MFNRLQIWLQNHLGVCTPALAIPAIAKWFATPRGQALLQKQQAHISRSLSYLFGYHLCQLSVCPDKNLSPSSKIGHKFALGPCSGKVIAACSDYRKLPLPAESIDVFLIHHALDFSQTPHQLLAEIARATVPRGHIIIVGFNPWSLLGLWRYFVRIVTFKPETRQQLLPLKRLKDWLELLDLKTINIEQGYYFPTKQLGNTVPQQVKMPFGGYYIVTARKDMEGVMPIEPPQSWEKVELGAIQDGAHSRL